MEIVLLAARVLLALVLGIAGIAKIADPAGSRRAIIGFGVPERLASLLAWCLPFAEILIAIALIPLSFAWFGAVAAAALLLAFAAGIAVNLARGQAPDCHCFGQLHSAPVSWSTFARNVILVALAGFIVVAGKNNPGLSALDWLAEMKPGEIVVLVLSAGATMLVATAVVYLRRLLSQQSSILARIDAMKKIIDEDYAEPPPIERKDVSAPVDGLAVGTLAPDFSLASIGGDQVTLDDLLAYDKPLLLLFVSPFCPPCEDLLPAIRDWEREHSNRLSIALVSKGTLEENEKRVAKYGARHLLLRGDSTVAEDYHAMWTPGAVVVSRYGRIASRVAFGDEPIRSLVAETVTPDKKAKQGVTANGNGHEPLSGADNALFNIGDPVPSFSLPDMEGNLVSAQSLRGRDSVLIFWDPRCRFCQAMSEDIRNWEDNLPRRAPRLVFLSVGELEDVEAQSRSFKSQFLHDRNFEISQLFGTTLTPTAVLIDREGRIASPLMPGLPNVLKLIGEPEATLLPIAPGF